RDFISIGLVWEAPKHASSGPGHLRSNKFVERFQSVTHFGVTLLDNRLAVVTTTPLGKAANCNGGGITCQLGVGKNFSGADADLRHDDQKPGFGQRNRLQLLTHAFGEGGTAAHEYRHVGAQRQPQFSQTVFVPAQLPQVVEADQGGSGVRAATADAAAHGQALVQPDIHARSAAAGGLQLAGGADDQVAVMRHAGNFGMQADLAVLAQGEAQFVAVVEELEQG